MKMRWPEKTILKNLGAGSYSVLVQIGTQLLLTPFLLRLWGAETYGQWLVLFTIPTAFLFSDAGVATSFANALAIAVEQRRERDAAAMVRAVWFWQFVIWGGFFTVFLALLVFAPVRGWMALEPLSGQTFLSASILLGLYSLGNLQGGFFMGVFRAGGQFAAYVRASGHIRLLEVAGIVVVVVAGGELVSAAASLVAVRLGFLGWCYARMENLLPGIDWKGRTAEWSEFAKLLPAGIGFLGFPVGNGLINQGATIAVNHFGGPTAVVVFGVGRQIARVFVQGVGIIFQSLHPEMSVSYARGDYSRLASLQSRALTPIIIGTPVFCAFLYLAGPAIFTLWSGQHVVLTPTEAVLFALEACAVGLGNASMLVSWSASRPATICISYLVTQSMALVIACLLFPAFSIAAFPLVFCVATLVHAAVSLNSGGRLAKTSGIRLFLNAMKRGRLGAVELQSVA